ncbi:MAG: RNA-binding protein [Rickettsiales bacterium]|nr:RNA-binding protein [Rickettsiales bacterium]
MVATLAASKQPTRRCIVSGELLDKSALLRFVLDEDDCATPDVAGKLPGRGIWVKCERATLEQAVKTNRFASSAKQTVKLRDDLVTLVEELLKARALNALALNRRAGNAIHGFEKVKSKMIAGEVKALLHAADASEDGIGKLSKGELFQCSAFSREELSQIMGVENAVHVAVLNQGAAEDFLLQCRRFTGFREGSSI